MSRFFTVFFLFFLVLSVTSHSQELIGTDTLAKTKKGKVRHVIGFPVILYSPELTWAVGGAGNYYFKFSRKDSLIRTSYIQTIGIVSLRGQLVLGIDGSIFFPNELFILRLHGSVSRFPDRFWGLGNDSRHNDRELYAISQYYLFPQLLRNVYRKFYVGAAYESQNVFSFEYYTKPNGAPSIFDTQNVPGRKGSFTSGLGLLLLWDSRDNTFSSSKGFYFQYYINRFSRHLGSQFEYVSQNLDVRKYVAMSRTSVMAFQFVGNFNEGEVPVRSMANIGSGTIMRGYYDGRYTDKNLIAVHVELRQHLVHRMGMVLFAGMGRVAGHFSEFFKSSSQTPFSGLKPSFGAGLRFAVDKGEKLNVRFDVGFGKHSTGVYLNLSEAF
jgi:hypothetical protein